MNLFEQVQFKADARQDLIESQERLVSNLEKSITLIKSTTAQQVQQYDTDIAALEKTIGIERSPTQALAPEPEAIDMRLLKGGRG
jgi:hypothetical protein